MEQETTTKDSPPTAEPKTTGLTEEFTRASDKRMIGGVAEGLARRTGIWSGWIRAAFVLLAFAGGFGIAAYAVLWVVIRADDEPDTILQRFFSKTNSGAAWIGAAFIFVAILIILGNVPFLSGGVVWAVGLIAVGFLLYSGDLPRLIKESSPPKEGVQQMTITTDQPEASLPEEGIVVGGDSVNASPPSPPTPVASTPPILPAPKPPREKSILGRLTFGVMVIALGVLALLDSTTNLVEPSPRHYIALAMTILGVGLLVGTVAGRARWLILVGLIATPLLLASPVLEFELTDWRNGTSFVMPDSPEAIPSTVSQGVGDVVIDLTDMEWNGQEVSLDAELDIGQMTIYIPDTVAVRGVGQSSIGVVEFEGAQSAGLNSALQLEADGSDGVLDLSALVRIGSLEIRRIPANAEANSTSTTIRIGS
jgi:phage shock protein PspC (stress-responsive transcriptional regulator)